MSEKQKEQKRKYTDDNELNSNGLLGSDRDITGAIVRAFGKVWNVTEKNYKGDWNVERTETNKDGEYKIRTSVRLGLSSDHPHRVDILALPNTRASTERGTSGVR